MRRRLGLSGSRWLYMSNPARIAKSNYVQFELLRSNSLDLQYGHNVADESTPFLQIRT
jgi:hypothetical protein